MNMIYISRQSLKSFEDYKSVRLTEGKEFNVNYKKNY